MTHLSELGPGFLLLHSSVGHQIIEYFSWGGEERGGEEERRGEQRNSSVTVALIACFRYVHEVLRIAAMHLHAGKQPRCKCGETI